MVQNTVGSVLKKNPNPQSCQIGFHIGSWSPQPATGQFLVFTFADPKLHCELWNFVASRVGKKKHTSKNPPQK